MDGKRQFNLMLITLDAIFIALYMGAVVLLDRLGLLPQHINYRDLILLGLASARLTDVISTDEIMQWLREPFVKLEKTEINGTEVEFREGRGKGAKKAVGELFSCPWCVGVWVAALLTYLYYLIPHYIWLFVLVLAIAEIGSLLQSFSTILVRFEKYLKKLGVPEEGI